MADRQQTPPEKLTRLREQILARCNLEEFRTLCADLGVSYDNLGGEGLEARARELVALLERLGRLPELEPALANLSTTEPSSATLPSLHQLPSPPRDFTGREAELAELLA